MRFGGTAVPSVIALSFCRSIGITSARRFLTVIYHNDENKSNAARQITPIFPAAGIGPAEKRGRIFSFGIAEIFPA